MKRLCAAAVIALAFAPAARAWQFEAGVGINFYETTDGRWYQRAATHALQARTPAVSFGVTGDIYTSGTYGVAWHADYVNLGHASADCICTPMDENYDANHHRMVTPRPYDVPDAFFSGAGNAQGVALTLEPYYVTHGWRFAAEAGVFGYLPKWGETVTNWQVGGVAPRTINVSTPRKLSLVPVVGASIGRDNWSLSYRHYFMRMANYGDTPPVWTDADVLEYKLRF